MFRLYIFRDDHNKIGVAFYVTCTNRNESQELKFFPKNLRISVIICNTSFTLLHYQAQKSDLREQVK